MTHAVSTFSSAKNEMNAQRHTLSCLLSLSCAPTLGDRPSKVIRRSYATRVCRPSARTYLQVPYQYHIWLAYRYYICNLIVKPNTGRLLLVRTPLAESSHAHAHVSTGSSALPELHRRSPLAWHTMILRHSQTPARHSHKP